MHSGFVQAALIVLDGAQVAQKAAFEPAVAQVTSLCQRRLVEPACILEKSLVIRQVAQVIQDQALQRPVVQLVGECMCAIQVLQRFTDVALRRQLSRRRDEQSGFEMPVPGSVGQQQARVEKFACLRHFTEHIKGAARHPVGRRLLARVQAR